MDPLLQQVIDGSKLNSDHTFVDADTIRDNEGNLHRLQGFDAPEIAKWKNGRAISEGTAGGVVAGEALQKLAVQQGFTNVVPLDEGAAFGRGTVDLTNDKGERFTQRLIETGAMEAGKHTLDQDLEALRVAELFGDKIVKEGDAEFAQAGQQVMDAMLDDGYSALNFKMQAVDEAELAAMNAAGYGDYYQQGSVQYRASDRDLKNRAYSPWSESWDTGWIGVIEAGYGAASLLGDTTGIEGLKEIGDQGAARASARVREQAATLTDYKDVHSFGTAMEFLGNNLAMSLPYMAFTMASAAATPLVGASALGVAAAGVVISPAAIYAGQIWNEQETKDATSAITGGVVQAALDRLGLNVILGKTGTSKEIFNQGVQALMKSGATREAAEKMLSNATRTEIAKLSGDAAKLAKEQLKSKKIVKEMLKRSTTGAVGEGATEALQEAIGYTAAHSGVNAQNFNWKDLEERMTAAVVAGGALGGSISAAGGVYDAGAWADVAYRTAPAEKWRVSQAGRFAEEEQAKRGYVPTIQELNAETRAKPDAMFNLNDRAEAFKQSKAGRSSKDVITDTLAAAPSLWRGATRWIFKPEIQAQSRAARVLADMFGGNLQRTYSGSNFESWKHHKVTEYKNMVDLPRDVWTAMTGDPQASRAKRHEASQEIYAQLKNAYGPDGKLDTSKITGPKRDTIISFAQSLERMQNKMWEDQKQYNPKLGYISNYLGRHKSFDKRAIEQDRVGFTQQLTKTYGITDAEATKIYDAIVDNEGVNDIDEAFSVTQGTPTPGSHKKRSLALSEQPEFQRYMEQDIFKNISDAAKAASRFQAYEQFVGKDGAHIAKLLDQMEAEGVPKATVDKIAAQLKDYLDAESGNYKRPTSEFGKTVARVQKHFMMLTMVSGLTLSTFSSLPELALTTKGLTRAQLKDLGNLGSKIGKEMWDTMGQGITETVKTATTGRSHLHKRTANQELLQDLGYYDWDVGAATTTGATELKATQQHLVQLFFKWNGLQGYTNMTRAIRASFAWDFFQNHFDTIQEGQGKEKTNEVQEAEEALRTLGIDPVRMLPLMMKARTNPDLLTPEEEAFANEQIREATFNFVNEAVALPGAANRPLIFQDPRFALFNQFQGFISTITANHIPKMWGEYIRRGSPAMKYSTFAMMVMMIGLGFASQELKDRVKFGESSPYLDDNEKLARGIYASGLLGSSERIIDTFFPLYESNSDSVAEWVWNEVSGQSPALRTAENVAKGGAHVAQGQFHEAAKDLSRSTPVLAPLSAGRKAITEAFDWDYEGGN